MLAWHRTIKKMSAPHCLDIFKHGHRAVCSGILISSFPDILEVGAGFEGVQNWAAEQLSGGGGVAIRVFLVYLCLPRQSPLSQSCQESDAWTQSTGSPVTSHILVLCNPTGGRAGVESTHKGA